MDVLAGDAPFLEEIDRPAIHAHRPDRQDEDQRPAGLARQLDLAGDLVAHEGVEVRERGAGDRLELRVPPGSAPRQRPARRSPPSRSIFARSQPAGRKPSIIEPRRVVSKFIACPSGFERTFSGTVRKWYRLKRNTIYSFPLFLARRQIKKGDSRDRRVSFQVTFADFRFNPGGTHMTVWRWLGSLVFMAGLMVLVGQSCRDRPGQRKKDGYQER